VSGTPYCGRAAIFTWHVFDVSIELLGLTGYSNNLKFSRQLGKAHRGSMRWQRLRGNNIRFQLPAFQACCPWHFRLDSKGPIGRQSARHAPAPAPQCMQPHAILLAPIAKDKALGVQFRTLYFGAVVHLTVTPLAAT
jgi:hypothetical protein